MVPHHQTITGHHGLLEQEAPLQKAVSEQRHFRNNAFESLQGSELGSFPIALAILFHKRLFRLSGANQHQFIPHVQLGLGVWRHLHSIWPGNGHHITLCIGPNIHGNKVFATQGGR